jgi:hypothetical protein
MLQHFRLNANEKAFRDEKDTKLLEWRNRLASVEDFLAGEKDKLEADDGSDVDLETVAKQRRGMEVCVTIYTAYSIKVSRRKLDPESL